MTDALPSANPVEACDPPKIPPDPIVAIVLRCQSDYAAWAAAHSLDAQAGLSETYRRSLEALWYALADNLRRVASGWLRSGLAPDRESLALNMFSCLVLSLPKLQVDEQKNVRTFLVTVARRGMIDDYRRANPSDSRGKSRWVGSLDDQPDVIDHNSSNIEEHTVLQIDQQALLDAVWQYWRSSLTNDDFRIMEWRWQSEPPRSFREIAQRMGPGWEEDTVRQRHHRIMQATRKYLREQRLIDDQMET